MQDVDDLGQSPVDLLAGIKQCVIIIDQRWQTTPHVHSGQICEAFRLVNVNHMSRPRFYQLANLVEQSDRHAKHTFRIGLDF